MIALRDHGQARHVQDLAGAVARVATGEAGAPREDLLPILRHSVVDEETGETDLIAHVNGADLVVDGRGGRDEVIVRRLLGIEGWREIPRPAEGAGELAARELDLPVGSAGDHIAPFHADVLDGDRLALAAPLAERIYPSR